MDMNDTFVAAVTAWAAGLLLSLFIEALMTPRPALLRPWGAWALHTALWTLAFDVCVLLLGRPWFSMAIVSAIMLTFILVNNAKQKALREPFVFQDYEYFTDAIRHPRLYIPFLGWFKFIGAAAGFVLAVAIGLLGESLPTMRFMIRGQGGAMLALLIGGLLLLRAGLRQSLPISLDPAVDLPRLGFWASFLRYGQEESQFPRTASPFDALPPVAMPASSMPHLVSIQSESFFDARALYPGVKKDVLHHFDQLKRDALVHGSMKVPAWGANTVRTEFAFLSGIANRALGVHRFNPYRAVAAGWKAGSVAHYLKRQGYRTVCIHPYPKSFYRRDRVFPRLGFDEFIDIEQFDEQSRFGPYVSDDAVAEKIESVLKFATGPVFIFVVTMENHGPLHLESVSQADIDDLYTEPPPAGCDDLTVYLRHLRNADRMLARLRAFLERQKFPARLCWYGDHVPIMPEVYQQFGAPDGTVEYILWSNSETARGEVSNTRVEEVSRLMVAERSHEAGQARYGT
ncbi:LTA synthase family protein [Herbaspirillum sp.]|uniref:LTA synthase family protein n=1 Tax=Herbaspirillum sp. TaxID=1890675 RepID=UPI002D79A7EB|nr:LTA synthase family protein [Herbaspirillum sp.]